MAEHNKEVLLDLYNDFDIENTSDPGRKHELYELLAEQYNLIVDPKFALDFPNGKPKWKLQTLRLKINNIKRAAGRKEWDKAQKVLKDKKNVSKKQGRYENHFSV